MALPTQDLGPPPEPKDPRFLQWLALLWAYVKASATGTNGVAQGGTGLTSVAQGDLLYGSAANTYSLLNKNTSATRYLANTGTNNNPAWSQIDLTNGVTGTLPVGNGGTGAATLTGLLQGTGTTAVTAITNSSTVGQVLRVTGASTYAWGALDLDDTDAVTGTLTVANGGTNLSTLTAHAVYVGNGTNAPTALTVGQTGYVLLGSTGADPYFGQLSHLSLADVQGGITTDVFEETAFEATAFQSGVTEYFHVLETDFDEFERQRSVATVAVNTTMTDDYATYVVTASAKTLTLPLVTAARLNRAWTVVQNVTGYVDVAPNVADSILLPGGSDTIRLDQIGSSLTVKVVAANTWVIT